MKIHTYRRMWAMLALFVGVGLLYSWRVYVASPIDEAPLDALAWEGKRVYQRYNCVACHQIFGLGGYLGPDLTNVTGRRDGATVRAFLRHGTARMPALGLSEEEVAAVVAFLEHVHRAGTFPVRSPRRVGFGMYDPTPHEP